MTVKELIDILSGLEDTDLAEIEWYMMKDDEETEDIELVRIGQFSISPDVTFTFEKTERPIMKQANFKRKHTDMVNETMKRIREDTGC